jgi:Nuclease-related domain/AAA domain
MVKMIPAKLEDSTNVGEKIIFDVLKPLGHVNPDWIILHSLKQVKVLKNLQAETDFLALIPGKGIVVVEAKGATGVSVEGDAWLLEGVPPAKKRSNPFDQIDNASRAIRKFLKGLGYDMDKIPFARLAWLPRIENPGSLQLGMAIEASELAFKKQVGEPIKTLKKAIEAQISRNKENPAIHYEPGYFTAEMAEHMASALRPRVSLKVDPETKAIERKVSRRKATEEQLVLLELVSRNENIYFEGAAGTGKTEMLRQSALEMRRNGRKVLYVCYNEMLAETMEKDLGQLEGISVFHINALLMKISGIKNWPKHANTEWFDQTLPKAALDNLPNLPGTLHFDAICIDEFQDIAARPLFFDVLMGLKRSAYMPFKLLMAGDDQQQIFGMGQPLDSFAFAKKNVPNLTHVSLNTNCRQSPTLSAAIGRVLERDMDVKRHRLPDEDEGRLDVYETTPERQAKDLAKVISQLLETYRPQDIRILSVYGGKGSVMAKLFEEKDTHSKELRELKKLLKHPISKEGKISWRSIGKYKGLEDDVVVLTDLSQASRKWLEGDNKFLSTQIYVGLTRARTHAVMLVQDGLYKKHAKKLN